MVIERGIQWEQAGPPMRGDRGDSRKNGREAGRAGALVKTGPGSQGGPWRAHRAAGAELPLRITHTRTNSMRLQSTDVLRAPLSRSHPARGGWKGQRSEWSGGRTFSWGATSACVTSAQ